MSYEDIFVIGWNLNLLMFIVNLFLAMNAMRNKSKEQLQEENRVLSKLKDEFDKYYPYRKYETLVTYAVPFTAFFRLGYRLIEMSSFFSRNEGVTMVDYMIYKYQRDIEFARNKD